MRTFFSFALLLLLLVGCKPEQNAVDANSNLTAQEIVDKNLFIDFTMDDFERQTRSAGGTSVRPIAAYRAAVYRFQRSVTRDEKGFDSTSAKCGKDLEMNEELFDWFVRDLKARNEALRNIPEGTKVSFGIRDEAYFNRLLNDVDGSIMKGDIERSGMEAMKKFEAEHAAKRAAEKKQAE